jgi:hypothetical protein
MKIGIAFFPTPNTMRRQTLQSPAKSAALNRSGFRIIRTSRLPICRIGRVADRSPIGIWR